MEEEVEEEWNSNIEDEIAEMKKESPEMEEVISLIENPENVEQIIKLIENSNDVAEVQAKLILLIEEFSKKTKNEVKGEEEIKDRIRVVSSYIMQQMGISSKEKNIKDTKYEYLDKRAKANIKAVMKRFMIYEVYKVANPHRIAGETRLNNFIHNVLFRGLKAALKYTSNRTRSFYSQEMIKNLEKKHEALKKSGRSIG